MGASRVGYIVKRFPRVSETFIAQEVLGLEALGVDVSVFSLWQNDKPAAHGWLEDLKARPIHCGGTPLSEAWKWLHRRALDDPGRKDEIEAAVALAFSHPSRSGRHRLCEAVGVSVAAEAAGVRHLHAHFANHPTFVALLVHLVTGLPFSFTAHAKDIYAQGPPAEVLQQQVEKAAFAITVSDANLAHLRSALPPSLRQKVIRLYNGVDLETIVPSPPAAGRESHLLVSVARLVEKKGIDLLLRAVALLRERGCDCRLMIAGDGPEIGSLETLRAQLGLTEHVDFLGSMRHEEVIHLIGRADVFVLPCRIASDGDRDALPTVLLEAMASGTPCVSTRLGGIPEIVEHRRSGLLAPTENPWGLAEAIDELLGDAELREVMSLRARERALRLFDHRRNVAALAAHFSDSIRGRGRAAAGFGAHLEVVRS